MREVDGQDAARQLRTAEAGDALVLAVLRRHGDVVLRVARRHSLCDEDAADASQRALEIFVRHVRRLDAETAHRWLFRVARNEAITLRQQRQRLLGLTELVADELEARHVESPEDRVIGLEATAQAAEALLALKASELQALVMQASGDSMAGIAQRSGWTATKVNRVVTEGRRRLRAQRDAIVEGRECERWRPALVALVGGQADAKAVAEVRPHLRNCGACRAHLRALHREAARPAAGGARVAVAAPIGLLAWAARLPEAVGTALQERATLRVLQVQTVAETLSAGKVAAVAASAAAIASGGAVVVDAGRPAGDRAGVRAAATSPVGWTSSGGSTRRPGSTPARRAFVPRAALVAGPLGSSGTAGRSAAPSGTPAPQHSPRRRPEFRPGRAGVVPAEIRSAQRSVTVGRSPEGELGPAARAAPSAPAAGAGEFAAPPAPAAATAVLAASATAGPSAAARPAGEFGP